LSNLQLMKLIIVFGIKEIETLLTMNGMALVWTLLDLQRNTSIMRRKKDYLKASRNGLELMTLAWLKRNIPIMTRRC